ASIKPARAHRTRIAASEAVALARRDLRERRAASRRADRSRRIELARGAAAAGSIRAAGRRRLGGAFEVRIASGSDRSAHAVHAAAFLDGAACVAGARTGSVAADCIDAVVRGALRAARARAAVREQADADATGAGSGQAV